MATLVNYTFESFIKLTPGYVYVGTRPAHQAGLLLTRPQSLSHYARGKD